MKLSKNEKWALGLIIVFVAASYFGIIQIPGFQWPTTITTPGVTTPTEGVAVTRPIKFTVTDLFGYGTTGTSLTQGIVIYDGMNRLEGLTTDSSAQATSKNSYPSGKVLNILYNSTTSKMWMTLTVPLMAPTDVESQTSNPVTIRAFTVSSGTDLLYLSNGTTYSDGSALNTTSYGSTTLTFTYSLSVTTDDTGFKSSYDPVNGTAWKDVMYVVLSGTGYSKFTITGMDGSFDIGTTRYYYKNLPDTALTKDRVGTGYDPAADGSEAIPFTIDCAGLSRTSSDSVTMQLYVYHYSDPAYLMGHSSYGPDAILFEEQTVTIAP